MRAGSALSSVLTKHGVARELSSHRLLSHWDQVVGPRVAARTFPDGLESGVLWVRVTNSAWLHELSFLREAVVNKANELCGEPLVSEVRFHLGGRRASDDDPLAPTLRIRRPPPRERPLPDPATGQRLRQIELEAAGIEDSELRAAIIEARRKLNR